MNRIKILQNLYRLFPDKTRDDFSFSPMEKFLQQNLGLRKALFVFRHADVLKTPDGKKPFKPLVQKMVLKHFKQLSIPWICQREIYFPWLGFWPVVAGGKWVGCYALGRKLDKDGLSEEEAQLMGLLADRTGLYLEERRLWRLLERVDRESSLGFLSAAVIHEIRNPLTALSALAQLLPQKKTDKNFLESFERLMLRETGRLTNLTENFLGFLRPTGKDAVQIDFTGIVNQMTDLLKPLFVAKGIQLKVNNSAGLYLMGDTNQIKSLILNLSQNAFESAGLRGTVGISTTWMPHSVHGPGSWIEFKVKNSGPGISKENLENVFNPYFSTKERGSGLGLTICQKVVENHQGIIKTSSSNRSTVFHVFLPAHFKTP
jgi:two-component system, NtrC family, sensor histidine kinase HydH